MYTSITIAASVLATLASAQSNTAPQASSTVSQSMPAVATQGFNAALISATQKSSWCTAQLNNCPKICGGVASSNLCDANGLTYSCICSNGTAPDVTAYQDTLPFFICEATFAQCINNHPNDAEGQQTCTNNEQCGLRNASANVATSSSAATTSASAPSSSSASSSMSSTASSTSSPSPTSSSSSSSSKSAASSMMTAQAGTVMFAGLLFVGALLL